MRCKRSFLLLLCLVGMGLMILPSRLPTQGIASCPPYEFICDFYDQCLVRALPCLVKPHHPEGQIAPLWGGRLRGLGLNLVQRDAHSGGAAYAVRSAFRTGVFQVSNGPTPICTVPCNSHPACSKTSPNELKNMLLLRAQISAASAFSDTDPA